MNANDRQTLGNAFHNKAMDPENGCTAHMLNQINHTDFSVGCEKARKAIMQELKETITDQDIEAISQTFQGIAISDPNAIAGLSDSVKKFLNLNNRQSIPNDYAQFFTELVKIAPLPQDNLEAKRNYIGYFLFCTPSIQDYNNENLNSIALETYCKLNNIDLVIVPPGINNRPLA